MLILAWVAFGIGWWILAFQRLHNIGWSGWMWAVLISWCLVGVYLAVGG